MVCPFYKTCKTIAPTHAMQATEQLPPQRGPENDLANFFSVHLTKPYSVNMTEPQQTRRHSPPGKQKKSGFLIFAMNGSMRTIANRGISNESVGAKFKRNPYFFPRFSVSLARPERFLYRSYWDPMPERGVPWGKPQLLKANNAGGDELRKSVTL